MRNTGIDFTNGSETYQKNVQIFTCYILTIKLLLYVTLRYCCEFPTFQFNLFRQIVVDAECLVALTFRQATFGGMTNRRQTFLYAVKTRSRHLGIDDFFHVDFIANQIVGCLKDSIKVKKSKSEVRISLLS